MLAATAFGVVAVGAGAGVLLYKWKNKDGDGDASRELDFSAIPAEKKVFGVALSEIKEEYKIDGVPKIIHDCFRIIKEKYVKEEGIFRISGDKARVIEIANLVEANENIELEKEFPHNLPAIVKYFLNQLPGPLLTVELYDQWIQLQIVNSQNEDEWVRQCRQLLKELPNGNYIFLKEFMLVMGSIEKESEENKMTPSNLSIATAPSICYRDKSNLLEQVTHLGPITRLVASIIENRSVLFD